MYQEEYKRWLAADLEDAEDVYKRQTQKKKGCTGIFRHFAWRCSAIMKNTGQPNNSAIR